MDDVLHAVDLDRRPVALHGGDLAAGDAPQQTGAVQVVQRARWMTSEQGQRIPAEVGGTLSRAAAAMYELVEVIQKNAPPMLRHSGMCR
jgi:hypothetical protein